MVKNNAANQARYRQRLIAEEPAAYYHKERDRKRAKYIPSSELTPEERDQRNQKARESAARVKAGVAAKRPRVVLPTEEEEDEPPTAVSNNECRK